DVEWNGIVEDANAAADHSLARIRTPDKARAWSGAGRIGDRLGFDAKTDVDRQMRIQHPVVLGKHRRLGVCKVERPHSSEINALQELAAGVFDQNRAGVKAAHVFTVAQHHAKLEGMLPGEVKWAGRPVFNPFKTIGAA